MQITHNSLNKTLKICDNSIVEEAMFSEKIIREKLREVRLKRGLSESQVAAKIGRTSNSSISRLESGETKLNFEVIQKLCEIYNLTPMELFNSSKEASPTLGIPLAQKKGYLERIMFRADGDAGAEIKDKVKELRPILRKVGGLQSKIGKMPISVKDIDPDFGLEIFQDEQASLRYAARFAGKLRERFGLGENSILNIADVCWDVLNIPITGLELGDEVWGIYSRDRFENPLIIFSSNCKNPQRSIFTIAHELGHHFFYKENLELDNNNTIYSENIYEKIANRFAQELLVPINHLRQKFDELGLSLVKELQPRHIVELSNYFKVSYQMIAYCLLQANKLTSVDYEKLKELGRHFGAKEWKELGYKSSTFISEVPDLHSRFEQIVLIAYRSKKITTLEATSFLDITSKELTLKI